MRLHLCNRRQDGERERQRLGWTLVRTTGQRARPVRATVSVLTTEERRSPERLRHHYEVERELADRLREATPSERRLLYSSLYDELFRRVPDHPQHTWKDDSFARAATAREQAKLLARHLRPTATFMEIGAGDCALSLLLAGRVRRVIGIDVSAEITADLSPPQNFELILTDGVSIPVAPETVDIAYSNQLMEHLHPEDARAQLRNIHTALAPGGVYVCITPNRLVGPSDISASFDEVATGFHLKEYTNRELAVLCHDVGFVKTSCTVWLRWRGLQLPTAVPSALEARIERRSPRLPAGPLRSGLQRFLGINMTAFKAA